MPKRKAAVAAKHARIKKKVDTDWFYARMADLGISLRGTAARLGMNVAVLSRRFHGQTVFDLYETVDLAHFLEVPFMEVVRRCGVEPPLEPETSVAISGVVGPRGEVDFKKRAGGATKIRRPIEMSPRAAAVRIVAPGAPLDGWVAFYVPTSKIEPDAVGRLCMARTRDGWDYMGVLSRSYQRGLWNLRALGGSQTIEDVDVATATPVLAIRN